MSERFVDLAVENGIAVVTINRPKSLNALSVEVLEQLGQVIKDIEKDDKVRAVIITGSGSKAFVAGADIAAMVNMTAKEARDYSIFAHKVFESIEQLPKPVIAAVNGYALGGGNELAMACDIRVASSTANFGQPEITLGIIPGFGGTQRLSRLVGKGKAMELILTGKMIDAKTAESIGLVNVVVPPEKLMETAKEIAQKIINFSPLAISFAKEAVNRGIEMTLEQGCKYEIELWTDCFTTEDQDIGMTAFLNKQKPTFKGA
ncbi:MAG: crotonase [Pelotomaculum sp.]|uniref:short-chain-enoyl-CoA hydratase n=1 Tax=Pelotomaculum thermopropionicum (strain DSM 13744 / JCM 10971 / SI) TaxID=370438 RepID=A5D4Y0_PELTS|nr:crotonase [Pelotomaculum sp.]BAF58696.1 enoyl-CoA hydratase/carnithine racemase [Pelotomaculum thermopropionicum SI]